MAVTVATVCHHNIFAACPGGCLTCNVSAQQNPSSVKCDLNSCASGYVYNAGVCTRKLVFMLISRLYTKRIYLYIH
jgi:hypothetical protein